MGTLAGIDEIRRAGLELGVGNPIAHHVTNVVITGDDDDEATTQSKGLAVMADGRCVSATYLDTLRRTEDGWRLSHRVILARRTPLNGAYLAGPDAAAPPPRRTPSSPPS